MSTLPRPSGFALSAISLAVPLLTSLALATPPPRFSDPTSVWQQNIASAPLHANSATMISALNALGGFGGGKVQIDFSLHIVHAAANAPTRTLQAQSGYYLPDCDAPGTAVPVPGHATIEGLSTQGDLNCDNTSEDCHLLVVQDNTLYELYSATGTQGGTDIEALCLAIWQLDASYPPEGRGEHCTSADAAGFPIAPLMFNADEIAASLTQDASGNGDLGHAIRFILPNNRMASDGNLGGVGGRLYVRPASHAGAPSGPANSVPYGARLRLRTDFPLDNYHPAARVVLNTFKRYGMVLADGGNIALTAESDLYTTAKWNDPGINIGPHVFSTQISNATPVTVNDFQVIDSGQRIAETYECVRSEPGITLIFRDQFETP